MSDERRGAYIHGTSAEEQRRLSALNGFINESCLRELAPRAGDKVLDVGCGLGQFARAVARVVGTKVVGVETDEVQLAEGRRQACEAGEETLVEFRRGDALALPLLETEVGTFDVAHARFVLEHVNDPLRAVKEMVRAVHPGGRVVLADDDHDVLRLYPEPAGFSRLWEAYMRSYDRLGNDPYVGRRLVSLLRQAGARPVRNTWIFFGSCAGHALFQPLVTNALTILRGARETIVRLSLYDPREFERTLSNLEDWGERDDAALWFSICWAEGRTP